MFLEPLGSYQLINYEPTLVKVMLWCRRVVGVIKSIIIVLADIYTVETLYSTIYDSKYFIELNFDKSAHYVALSGELWSVSYEYFNRNWSCYKGFLLYVTAPLRVKGTLK